MKITLKGRDGEEVTIEMPDRTPYTIKGETPEPDKDVMPKVDDSRKETAAPEEQPEKKKQRTSGVQSERQKANGGTKMEQIAKLYMQSKTTAEIAKAVGSSVGSVSTMIRMLKKQGRIGETRQPRDENGEIILTKTQKELIHDMHANSKYSDAKIAAELDLTIEMVKKELGKL